MSKTANKPKTKSQNQETPVQPTSQPAPQPASQPESLPAAASPAGLSAGLPIKVGGLPSIRRVIAGGGLAAAANEFAAAFDEAAGESREFDPKSLSFPIITVDHQNGVFMVGEVPFETIEGFPIGSAQIRKWWSTRYNPAKPTAPDCASENGVVPVANAASPQAATCAACPHDVWGTSQTGEGKACRTETLIFVLNPEISEVGLSVMIVPPTSITSWIGTAFKRGYWETAKLTPSPNGAPIGRTQLVWTRFGLEQHDNYAVLKPEAVSTAQTPDEFRAIGEFLKMSAESMARFRSLRSSTGSDRD